MEQTQKNVKTIQSVHRALDILEFLIFSGDGQRLSAITEHCGLNKTTAFHLIKTLEARGYLEQSPDSLSYKTGGKVFELALKAYQNINLTQICQPYLEQLSDQFNETAGVFHYSKIDGRMQTLCTSYLESTHPVKVSVTLGKWLPLSSTAVGRLYLSCLPDDVLEETLQQEHYSPASEKERKHLYEQIAEAKKKGYCIEREEYEEGVVNLAVPIYKYSGRAIASICITMPSQRADQNRLQEMISAMKPISKAISALPL